MLVSSLSGRLHRIGADIANLSRRFGEQNAYAPFDRIGATCPTPRHDPPGLLRCEECMNNLCSLANWSSVTNHQLGSTPKVRFQSRRLTSRLSKTNWHFC